MSEIFTIPSFLALYYKTFVVLGGFIGLGIVLLGTGITLGFGGYLFLQFLFKCLQIVEQAIEDM